MDHLPSKISIPQQEIEAFCAKWKVREFALFGSVVREDFHPDSDVDVLITLEDDAPWSLFEWVEMMDELKAIFGRDIDLVEKPALRNPFRRQAILKEARVLYAA